MSLTWRYKRIVRENHFDSPFQIIVSSHEPIAISWNLSEICCFLKKTHHGLNSGGGWFDGVRVAMIIVVC